MHMRSLPAYLSRPGRGLFIGLFVALFVLCQAFCYGGEDLSNVDLGLLQSAAQHIGQGHFAEGH